MYRPTTWKMSLSELEYDGSNTMASSVAEMTLLIDNVHASMDDAEDLLVQRIGDLCRVVNTKDQKPDDDFMMALNQALDALVDDAAHFGNTSRVSVQSLVDEMRIAGCRDASQEMEIASLKARLDATECHREEEMKRRDAEIEELRWKLESVLDREQELVNETIALRMESIETIVRTCVPSREMQQWQYEYDASDKIKAVEAELAECKAVLASFEGHCCVEVAGSACARASAAQRADAAAAEDTIHELEKMVLELESQLRASDAALENEQEQVANAARMVESLEVAVCDLQQCLVDDAIAYEETRQKLQEELDMWKMRAMKTRKNDKSPMVRQNAAVVATTAAKPSRPIRGSVAKNKKASSEPQRRWR